MDLSSARASYWVHPATGQIVAGDRADFDPRTAADPAWQRLRRARKS